MKILIGTPILESVKGVTHHDLMSLWHYSTSSGTELDKVSVTGSRFLHIVRNDIVRAALNGGFDAVMFIDSDMSFPADGLERLLSHNKDVVGGLYFHREYPNPPCVFGTYDERHDRFPLLYEPFLKEQMDPLVKVGGIATGFMLIKSHVFRMIPHPWFHFTAHPNGANFTEDVYFNKLLHRYGVEVWCDTTLDIGHIGDYAFRRKDFTRNYKDPEGNEVIHQMMRLDKDKLYANTL